MITREQCLKAIEGEDVVVFTNDRNKEIDVILIGIDDMSNVTYSKGDGLEDWCSLGDLKLEN